MHRPLPVTLVGGFLGAGKTSLLHHVVSEHRGGHLALLIEDGGAPHLDAAALRGLCGAMRRAHDAIIDFPAGDDTEQAAWLAGTLRDLSREEPFERVLIEVAGTTNPARLVAAFRRRRDAISSGIELGDIICVIDALDFHRTAVAPQQGGEMSALLDFQLAQIKGATLLVLNKCDLVGEAERTTCLQRLTQLNPTARWLETAYGELPEEVWARSGAPKVPARPPITAGEISAIPALARMAYRVHRPFHPARLWDWFQAEHPGLWRVKGLVWLATRNLFVGGISRTRRQNSCGAAGIWWAALPREEWPADAGALEWMRQTWREPYGDRRQELVLIGEAAGLTAATRALDGCLLTAEELARPVKEWTTLPDPFPAWDVGEDVG